MTIVQERAVFENVETRFCECCAGVAFTAAPAPHIRAPPTASHFFYFFGFDAQMGCGVVGFSSAVCSSWASNDSIATHPLIACAADVALQARLLCQLRPERRVQATEHAQRPRSRSNGHDYVRMILIL
jgi:hypothetical protein